ncbi:MAG: AMP-binding protein [Thiolinea sp.]
MSTVTLPDSLLAALRQYAASTPDKPALIFQDQCLSYAQLLTTVEQTVTVFAELELKPGDRIVWYGMNHPEMLILLFAAAESGRFWCH